MRLSDIFDALGSGELANLHLVENNTIIPDKLPIVLNAINLALTDLHTKFLLKRELVKINIEPTIETYKITNGDFIEVLNSDMNGIQYSLLNPNTLYVKADKPTVITIEYKASHRKLTEEDILEDSEVDLPLSYLNALLYFIGSRMYVSVVNQLDGDLNESARYASMYQAELLTLTNQGIDVDHLNNNDWFYERGFR